jgi:hypothetical protein
MPKKYTLKSKRPKKVNKRKHTRRYSSNKKYKTRSRSHSKFNRRSNFRKSSKMMRGGFGPGAGPVGYSWKADPSTWPGAYASNGGNTNGMTFSNHYQYNPQGTGVGGLDPAISTRGDLADLYSQSGGGAFQDVINLGRSAEFGVKDFFSQVYGTVNPPTDPNPVKHQFASDNYKVISSEVPNIRNIVKTSADSVARI